MIKHYKKEPEEKKGEIIKKIKNVEIRIDRI